MKLSERLVLDIWNWHCDEPAFDVDWGADDCAAAAQDAHARLQAMIGETVAKLEAENERLRERISKTCLANVKIAQDAFDLNERLRALFLRLDGCSNDVCTEATCYGCSEAIRKGAAIARRAEGDECEL